MNRVLLCGGGAFLGPFADFLGQIDVDIETAGSAQLMMSRLTRRPPEAVIVDGDSPDCRGEGTDRVLSLLREFVVPFIWVSADTETRSIERVISSGAAAYVLKPFNLREFIARLNAVLHRKIRIACVGGGTGLFSLLMGLKALPNAFLTSVVSMTDDGGSSGRLRASLGILPPGDVRRSLVALSNAPELMNEVLQYRFPGTGELAGHSFGNLFLAALAEIRGSMSEAVKGLGDLLNIQGIVIPATPTETTLCAEFEDGTTVKGESKIDAAEERRPELRIRRLWHEPEAACEPNAYASLLAADIITVGPGDLFTSIVTNLIVKNFSAAIAKSRAKIVYICNLMTKPGETSGYTAGQHVEEVLRYIGGDRLDYVILSNTRISEKAAREYAKQHQAPVDIRDAGRIRAVTRAEILIADVGHETELVRHDSAKIRNEIGKIIALRLSSPRS